MPAVSAGGSALTKVEHGVGCLSVHDGAGRTSKKSWAKGSAHGALGVVGSQESLQRFSGWAFHGQSNGLASEPDAFFECSPLLVKDLEESEAVEPGYVTLLHKGGDLPVELSHKFCGVVVCVWIHCPLSAQLQLLCFFHVALKVAVCYPQIGALPVCQLLFQVLKPGGFRVL